MLPGYQFKGVQLTQRCKCEIYLHKSQTKFLTSRLTEGTWKDNNEWSNYQCFAFQIQDYWLKRMELCRNWFVEMFLTWNIDVRTSPNLANLCDVFTRCFFLYRSLQRRKHRDNIKQMCLHNFGKICMIVLIYTRSVETLSWTSTGANIKMHTSKF
jgi:hypothetical protein